MIRVKVCGLTRPADVTAAVAAGVDACGFNLARGPRRISPEHARGLAAQLPPFCAAVGLFVDADAEAVLAAMRAARCQVVQLHGQEPPEFAERLREHYPVIKAFAIRDAASLAAIADYPADAYLLDAHVPGLSGGTGTAWDHGLLAGCELGRPVILAGGLTPENVAAAAALRPWGVDTASGVEAGEPGVKDHGRMARFVAAARRGNDG